MLENTQAPEQSIRSSQPETATLLVHDFLNTNLAQQSDTKPMTGSADSIDFSKTPNIYESSSKAAAGENSDGKSEQPASSNKAGSVWNTFEDKSLVTERQPGSQAEQPQPKDLSVSNEAPAPNSDKTVVAQAPFVTKEQWDDLYNKATKLANILTSDQESATPGDAGKKHAPAKTEHPTAVEKPGQHTTPATTEHHTTAAKTEHHAPVEPKAKAVKIGPEVDADTAKMLEGISRRATTEDLRAFDLQDKLCDDYNITFDTGRKVSHDPNGGTAIYGRDPFGDLEVVGYKDKNGDQLRQNNGDVLGFTAKLSDGTTVDRASARTGGDAMTTTLASGEKIVDGRDGTEETIQLKDGRTFYRASEQSKWHVEE